MSDPQLAIMAPVDDQELNELHAVAFGHDCVPVPWGERLGRHSLFWVTARWRGRLVGFVNIIGDGGAHAVLLDTCVHPDVQGQGVGRSLVSAAVEEAERRGCHWLHADYASGLADFYERSCGMSPTAAGLLRLTAGRA